LQRQSLDLASLGVVKALMEVGFAVVMAKEIRRLDYTS
jgi:hypothetical protein